MKPETYIEIAAALEERANKLEWLTYTAADQRRDRRIAAALRAEVTIPEPEPEPEPEPPGLPEFFPFALHLMARAAPDSDFARYKAVILNAWDWKQAVRLRKLGIKTYVYQCASSARPGEVIVDGVPLRPTPTTFTHAQQEGWLLLRPDGTPNQWAGYNAHYQCDIGLDSYRAHWAAKVARLLTDYDDAWDGVFVDNLLTRFVSGGNYYGIVTNEYTSDGAWQDAYLGFLQGVRGFLHATGKQTIGNLQEARLFPGIYKDWLTLLDGAMEEFWCGWDGGTLGQAEQAAQVTNLRATVAAGKPLFCRASETGAPFATAWARFQEGGGKGGFSHQAGYDVADVRWHDEYTP